MASPTAATPSPQFVGNAFVEQYYEILCRSPRDCYKFYQESSSLSHPNLDGVMTTVTTTQAINDMILSLDYKDYIAQIATVDSQLSYSQGVFVLVTGWLIGKKDKVRRKFSQSFLLFPQGNGCYFVLNDLFRFVGDFEQMELNQLLANGFNDDASEAPVISDPVQDHHVVDPVSPPSNEVPDDGEVACKPIENGDKKAEQEVVVDPPVDPPVHHSEPLLVSEVTSSVKQDDAPKKAVTYASVVNSSAAPVYVPTSKAKPAPVPTTQAKGAILNPEKSLTASTTPAPAPETSVTSDGSITVKNNFDEVKGYSVYIRNLPLNATSEHVREEFKKFGPIKLGGVQVRNHRIERSCFGFVEFESLNSMVAAIEASPITIDGTKAFVQEKRSSIRVVNGVVTSSNGVVTNGNGNGSSNGRGRYPPGRAGYWNDGFRGRGGFVGNQGFGRSDFRNWGEYPGRGRGPLGRGREGYHHQQQQQRVFQNGVGRSGRPSGATEKAEATV